MSGLSSLITAARVYLRRTCDGFCLMEYPCTAEQIDRQNLSYYYGTLENATLSDSFDRLRHDGYNEIADNMFHRLSRFNPRALATLQLPRKYIFFFFFFHEIIIHCEYEVWITGSSNKFFFFFFLSMLQLLLRSRRVNDSFCLPSDQALQSYYAVCTR